MESGTANLLGMLQDRVRALVNEGKWNDALKAAESAVDKARSSLSGGDMDSLLRLAETLELKANIYRDCGYLEEARVLYLEALELLNGRVEFTEELARVSASVGVLYDNVENDEEAVTFYTRSIELYERLGGEFMADIADICNNLGFIYRANGHFDQAEKIFLRGLEISYEKNGVDSEKTAIFCNNVGALYLATGNIAQAREMNTMALDTRISILGKNHPDTAQSHSNLAMTLAQSGEAKEAKENFQASVEIYERHIKEEGHEYAAVVENYAEFLRQIGDKKGVTALLKRAKKKLSKVGLVK